MEIWRDIKGYEGRYQISNKGKVKSLMDWNGNASSRSYYKREKELIRTDNGHGYLIVSLRNMNAKRQNKYVHRLVAEAFIENPNNYKVVNHIDFNILNNNVENLEWCTTKQNVRHSRENMCHPKNSKLGASGEKYITIRENKKYKSFEVKYKSVRTAKYKSFRTLDEAIKYRDEVVKSDGVYS